MLFLLFTVLYYSEIRCIVLYVLHILFVCLFFFFCSFNHLSGPIRKQMFTCTSFKRSWFVIRDWLILIRFVCFVFQCSLLCDRPVSCNNGLV